MDWEKGIIVGCTGDQKSYFLASSHDTLIMYNSAHGSHKMGDCVEFQARIYTGRTDKVICQRIVTSAKAIPKFIDFEIEKKRNSCLLICNIIDVQEQYHEEAGENRRVLRTDFLEKVYDCGFRTVTARFSKSELLNMKVLCKRVVDHKTNVETWAALNLTSSNSYNFPSRAEIEMSELVGFRSEKASISNGRKKMSGFACTVGTKLEELYVWVPGHHRDILILPSCLKEPPSKLHGRWVSFLVNKNGKVDSQSDVHVIDDMMPTRKHRKDYEIKVPCYFNVSEWDERDRIPILKSDLCGKIADVYNTLRNYNRLRNFEDSAWVYSSKVADLDDVRFVLSDRQDRWLDEEFDSDFGAAGNRHQEGSHFYGHSNSKSCDFDDSNYGERRNYEFDDYERRQSSEKLRDDRFEERYPTKYHDRSNSSTKSSEDRSRESYFERASRHMDEDRFRLRRDRSPERSFENESYRRREEDFDGKRSLGKEKKWEAEEFQESLFGDEADESGVLSDNHLSPPNYNEPVRSLPEEDVVLRFPGGPEFRKTTSSEVCGDQRPSSIKSAKSEKNMEEAVKIEKTELELLKEKIESRNARGIAIDDDMRVRLKKLTKEENARKKLNEINESVKNVTLEEKNVPEASNSLEKVKELKDDEKCEKDQLESYRRLATLVREMLTNSDVRRVMRSANPKAAEEINQILFEL